MKDEAEPIKVLIGWIVTISLIVGMAIVAASPSLNSQEIIDNAGNAFLVISMAIVGGWLGWVMSKAA